MGLNAFVTHALEENNVRSAVILGKSLRSTFTQKHTLVIVRPSLPLHLWAALEATFDTVLPLNEKKCGLWNASNMTPDVIAIHFATGLSFVQDCIYMPPDSIVIRNCDVLFTDRNFAAQILQTKRSLQKSVFHITPSSKLFNSIAEMLLACKPGNGLSGIFQSFFVNNKFLVLEPFSAVADFHDNRELTASVDLSICTFVQSPKELQEFGKLNQLSPFKQCLHKYWLKLSMEAEKSLKTPDIVNGVLAIPQQQRKLNEPIAIVGMSCRFPSSNNLSEFWDLLVSGRDGITNPPEYRWRASDCGYHDPASSDLQAGFLAVPIDVFDAKFFGVTPNDTKFVDPQIRLLLELVWESLEHGGFNALQYEGQNVGVFTGSWRNDYSKILRKSSCNEFFRYYMGNSIGAGAARISHVMGFKGPCVATESACSAGMVAVHLAIESLRKGDSSIALACGVNLLVEPFMSDFMPMIHSPDGHCKTFDRSADGYGRAEGAGVLVLKRLSDAIRDEDNIWGVIRGSAIVQEGTSKNMGTPTIDTEAEAMRGALTAAGVDPADVSYVEAHGTGTAAGDPIEIAAIRSVYSAQRREPLVIGSVKTNVGHTESSSGITGIIKVILSMQHEIIPAHRNFTELNPNINLDNIPAKLPLEAVPWPKIEGKPRLAGISSFGITGTDSHLILEEPGRYTSSRIGTAGFERPLHIMTIAAKTEDALESLLRRYKEFLNTEKVNSEEFADIAYSANTGRAHFPHRAAIVADNARAALLQLTTGGFHMGTAHNDRGQGKICFLFNGEGGPCHSMGKKLYESSPVFKGHFDECEYILKTQHDVSIAETLWCKKRTDVYQTLHSSAGTFIMEYCLMKLWESWGVKPFAVAGHGLGEFCAAVCAGLLTLEEGLALVAAYTRLMEMLQGGKKIDIKASKSRADSLIKVYTAEKGSEDFWLDCVAVNSMVDTAYIGDSKSVDGFADWLISQQIRCSVSDSSHAVHSRLVDPVLETYAMEVKNVLSNDRKTQTAEFVSGTLGRIVDFYEYDDFSQYWIEHAQDQINFEQACCVVNDQLGCIYFVEVGVSQVLNTYLVANTNKRRSSVPSLKLNEGEWSTMLESLAELYVNGVNVDWKSFDQFYARKRLGYLLPTYPFIRKRHWPTITETARNQLHPLLGSNIPNPTRVKLFENQLRLEDSVYLREHRIGSIVVFPGAAYVEMFLVAGYLTLVGALSKSKRSSRAIQLRNFRIDHALSLPEDLPCFLQTVVEPSGNDGGIGTKIFHREYVDTDAAAKWIPHASGILNLYSQQQDSEVHSSSNYYNTVIENIQTTGQPVDLARDFYSKQDRVNLHLGEPFRLLSNTWWNSEKGLVADIKIPEDTESFLIHPCIIDAMIQGWMVHQDIEGKGLFKKLTVPMGFESFVWYREMGMEDDNRTSCHIYVNWHSKSVLLLDAMGNVCAKMTGLITVQTTSRAVAAMLETQVCEMPNLYKLHLKKFPCTLEDRLSLSTIKDPCDSLEEIELSQRNWMSDRVTVQRELNKLADLYVTKALLRLGWQPLLNEKVDLKTFANELGIYVPHYVKLLRQFIRKLEEQNLLSFEDGHWRVVSLPPSENDIHKQINSQLVILQPKPASDMVEILSKVGDCLDKILTGAINPLPMLFPEDDLLPSARRYYRNAAQLADHALHQIWDNIWSNISIGCKESGGSTPTIRILEVGAGTGCATTGILESLNKHGLEFEYHYTDISSSFFAAAEKQFGKNREQMTFLKLNVEQDATSQGFPPNYYDIVIACEMLHATRDLKASLLNIHTLLRHGGNLILYETVSAQSCHDIIFGLLDGYWQYTDFELRQHHPLLTAQQWREVSIQTGFSAFAAFVQEDFGFFGLRVDKWDDTLGYSKFDPIFNPKMQKIMSEAKPLWIIFHSEGELEYVNELKKKFDWLNNKTVVFAKQSDVLNLENTSRYHFRPEEKADMSRLFEAFREKHVTDTAYFEGIIVTWGLNENLYKQEHIARPFLYIIQNVLSLERKSRPQIIVLDASRYAKTGDILPTNPFTSTLMGIAKTVANEHLDLRIRGIEVDVHDNTAIESTFQELFIGFNDDHHLFSTIQGTTKRIPKILPERPTQKEERLPLPPATDRFKLVHPKSKTIQDLEFAALPVAPLKPTEVEVHIKCSGLNFRDIFNVLKPSADFQACDGIGVDFAGIVVKVGEGVKEKKVGDAVFGFDGTYQALPSHLRIDETACAHIGDSFTFAEAACFPTVFCTAFICMVEIANCQAGEKILIHTATGGVGLAAIQLARHFGLEIFCTVGSKTKRAYLESLGIKHIFHSRNLSFKEKILEATDGMGIDIVLNSLTGPGFKEATLDCLATGGRFIEMSRLHVWTDEDVAALRADVKYSLFDLTRQDSTEHLKMVRRSLAQTKHYMDSGIVKALPVTRYDAQNIREALNYLQSAKHIGKIVVTMPQISTTSLDANSIRTPLFNDRSTYLITGGTGGVGLEFCKYMLDQGAKYIVLNARKPPNEESKPIINQIRAEYDCSVELILGDVGNRKECEELFRKIEENPKLPPIRGIIHSAGSLSDGLIENLTWDHFNVTYQSKVAGTWNLHDLTKNYNLEYFVLFSSVVAPSGSPGQSTHVSACTFQDAFAHYRNAMGLRATSINLGQFALIGIAAEAELQYMEAFSPRQGINAIDYILRNNKSHIIATKWRSLASALSSHPFLKTVLHEQVLQEFGENTSNLNKKVDSSGNEFWQDFSSIEDPEQRLEVVSKHCKKIIRQVLVMPQDELLSDEINVQDIGVDSLLMLDLKNLLEAVFKIEVAQSLLEESCIGELSSQIYEMLENKTGSPESETRTATNVSALVATDSVLPEHIKAITPGSQVPPSHIKTILLTGVTGWLGSHMLVELLNEYPHLHKIYCLVRPTKDLTVADRLQNSLNTKGLQISTRLYQKVEVISGNIAQKQLGVSKAHYVLISKDVDAIVNCAAHVNLIEQYTAAGEQSVRSVNVFGLLNLLEFCVAGRATKHLFHVSSVVAASMVDKTDGSVMETWPVSTIIEENRGYVLSKYIGEFLLGKATSERNIPCKAFRLGEIRSNSKPGNSNVLSSQAMRSLMFVMKEGVMPDIPIFLDNFIPVDVACKLTCGVLFNDDAPNEVYNVTHRNPQSLLEYFPPLAAEFGHKVKIVPFETFRTSVTSQHETNKSTTGEENNLLALFRDLYNEDEYVTRYAVGPLLPTNSSSNADFLWNSKRLTALIPGLYAGFNESSYDILKRDLLKAKQEGLFEKFGLVSKR